MYEIFSQMEAKSSPSQQSTPMAVWITGALNQLACRRGNNQVITCPDGQPDPHPPSSSRKHCVRLDISMEMGLISLGNLHGHGVIVSGEGVTSTMFRPMLRNTGVMKEVIASAPQPVAHEDGCPCSDGRRLWMNLSLSLSIVLQLKTGRRVGQILEPGLTKWYR